MMNNPELSLKLKTQKGEKWSKLNTSAGEAAQGNRLTHPYILSANILCIPTICPNLAFKNERISWGRNAVTELQDDMY
jgi:hypothetical protein